MSTLSGSHKPICYSRGKFGCLKRHIINMVKKDPSQYHAMQSVIDTVRNILKRWFGDEYVNLYKMESNYVLKTTETDKIPLTVLMHLYQMEEE